MNDTPAHPDLQTIKARQQVAWAAGDYAVLGSTLQLSGELLCEALDLRSGSLVLDVAAGNGNVTLAAARRGARVTSTDYVPTLLERGRLRAAAEGWKIDFEHADAEALPFADGSFDVVVSTFGVMFAPDQPRAASELARVCRPGGKIGLSCWTPEGFVGQIFRIMGKHLPPPAGLHPPFVWGTRQGLRELFPNAQEIHITTLDFIFRSRSTAEWLDTFKKFYGPMNKAFAALDPAQHPLLDADLIALADSLNRADDGTMVLPSSYLQVVIDR